MIRDATLTVALAAVPIGLGVLLILTLVAWIGRLVRDLRSGPAQGPGASSRERARRGSPSLERELRRARRRRRRLA